MQTIDNLVNESLQAARVFTEFPENRPLLYKLTLRQAAIRLRGLFQRGEYKPWEVEKLAVYYVLFNTEQSHSKTVVELAKRLHAIKDNFWFYITGNPGFVYKTFEKIMTIFADTHLTLQEHLQRQNNLILKQMQAQEKTTNQVQTQEKTASEINELLSISSLCIFYKETENSFNGKLSGVKSLYGELVKREDTKRDIGVQIIADVASGTIGSIPLAGGVLGNLASTGVAVLGGVPIDKAQMQKIENVASNLGFLKDADNLGELTARRLTQYFSPYIINNNLQEAAIVEAAKKATRISYNYLKEKKITAFAQASLEKKAELLVQQVSIEAAKKLGIFEESVTITSSDTVKQEQNHQSISYAIDQTFLAPNGSSEPTKNSASLERNTRKDSIWKRLNFAS